MKIRKITALILSAVISGMLIIPANAEGIKLGDVNSDGNVDAIDASEILTEYAQTSVGKDSVFTEEQKKSADVNYDGAVNAVDASLVLGFYAYKSTGGTMNIEEYMKNPPKPKPTEPVTNPPKENPIDVKMKSMSLHEKVCQMFIVTPESMTGYNVTSPDAVFEEGYGRYPVGGFIFFDSNIISIGQTKNLLGGIQRIAENKGTGAFMAVDEEGGYITRVQKLGEPAVNSMSYYGGLNDYNTAFSVGETIGGYLKKYGFNLDFAPVADVTISSTNELGTRIFSSNPDIVGRMAGAVSDGLHSNDVCSTLKHFPGLGAGSGNTHYSSVVIDRSLAQLRGTEFPAFKKGIDSGCDFVMVGHQITTGSGDGLPGDLSKTVVTDWLKGELSFRGLAITDSHKMGAIVNNYSSGDAAVLAIEAGIDVILMPDSLISAVSGIENAVASGRISEDRIDESVAKILDKKESMGILK